MLDPFLGLSVTGIQNESWAETGGLLQHWQLLPDCVVQATHLPLTPPEDESGEGVPIGFPVSGQQGETQLCLAGCKL